MALLQVLEMEITLKVDYSMLCNAEGINDKIFTFRCPRCSCPHMFFSYEACPIICGCGRIFPDIKALHNSLVSRIKWHIDSWG